MNNFDNQTAQGLSSDGSTKKKVHIETWGCQMNVADSEKMLGLLNKERYDLVSSADDADLVLLNTCHIREKARHKVLSRLGVLNALKERKPNLKIAVTGCVAQADGAKLLDLAPQIDVLIGPGKIDDLPRLLEQNARSGEQAFAVGFDRHKEEKHDDASGARQAHSFTELEVPSVTGRQEVSRFVNIIQGCNNFCTFCVVPFTRGREISRSSSDVVREVRSMIAQGAKEITLLGQNVNSYGLDLLGTDMVPNDGGPFVSLLREVCSVEGLERIRFTTSNPHDFTRPLAKLFREEPKLGKYIHLPVQAGHDRTLSRMKRKVTVDEYLERISWLKSEVPDIAISTDLIVGFPGETDEEFEGTLDLIREVKFSFVFAFMYSPRKGTAAARFLDQISEPIKQKRLAELNRVQDEITTELNEAEIGQVRDVLFIYESQKEPGVFIGRTDHYRAVRAYSATNIIGKILPVKIETGNKVALQGRLYY